MKNKELFDKTISILVKAYFEGTLDHSCRACAVGNMICAANNISPKDFWNYQWSNVFVTTEMSGQSIYLNQYVGEAKRQIDSTGYNVLDLAKIENAFENGDRYRDNMFSGLMSVVDCLMNIHSANETEIAEAKQLFLTPIQ